MRSKQARENQPLNGGTIFPFTAKVNELKTIEWPWGAYSESQANSGVGPVAPRM